jgi:lactoylglutathione lyase
MASLFRMHHASLYVRDVHASAAFYKDVLGLEEIPNRVGRSHIRWFVVDDFRTIHLIGGDELADRPRPFSTHLAFTTADLDAATARLDQHGVVWINLAREPRQFTRRQDGVRQIYFQDPDGHWLEINDAESDP